MMLLRLFTGTIVLLALAATAAHAQLDAETREPFVLDDDHGELPPGGLPAVLDPAVAGGYGYGYDSLLSDIYRWISNPRVHISTIGTSVQGRPLWQLSITSPAGLVEPRAVVAIHARTHPNEPQGSWVVNAIIEHLLSDDPAMKKLLEKTVFNIIPMYNPDGVELEAGRGNADGVDLEREWDKEPAAKEAAHLKARYAAIMGSPTPIRVMLNLHSAYLCKRYFVYHVAEATSTAFAEEEQRFITGVRRYFMSGIERWDFYQSWQDGAPTHFPESWFWHNYAERVMALTYEDMHCDANGAYDTTAYAILRGIADYLQIDVSAVGEERSVVARSLLRSVAPNPFSAAATIRYSLPQSTHVTLRVFDAVGAEVAVLADEAQDAGWHEIRWNAPQLAAGVYYVTLHAGATTNTLPVLKMR
jgi:hypothetical protein